MKNLIIAAVSTNIEKLENDQFVDIYYNHDDLGADRFDLFSVEELKAQKDALIEISKTIESFQPELQGLIRLLSMLS